MDGPRNRRQWVLRKFAGGFGRAARGWDGRWVFRRFRARAAPVVRRRNTSLRAVSLSSSLLFAPLFGLVSREPRQVLEPLICTFFGVQTRASGRLLPSEDAGHCSAVGGTWRTALPSSDTFFGSGVWCATCPSSNCSSPVRKATCDFAPSDGRKAAHARRPSRRARAIVPRRSVHGSNSGRRPTSRSRDPECKHAPEHCDVQVFS